MALKSNERWMKRADTAPMGTQTIAIILFDGDQHRHSRKLSRLCNATLRSGTSTRSGSKALFATMDRQFRAWPSAETVLNQLRSKRCLGTLVWLAWSHRESPSHMQESMTIRGNGSLRSKAKAKSCQRVFYESNLLICIAWTCLSSSPTDSTSAAVVLLPAF